MKRLRNEPPLPETEIGRQLYAFAQQLLGMAYYRHINGDMYQQRIFSATADTIAQDWIRVASEAHRQERERLEAWRRERDQPQPGPVTGEGEA